MNIIWSVIKKEFVYISRDRRTIFMGLLGPVLFMCLLNWFGTNVINDTSNNSDGIYLAEIILAMVLTMIIFLSILTGALEIGIGEKERGTLRSLLRTGIDFRTLFWGKYLAIVLQGLISLFISNIAIVVLSRIPNTFFYIIFNMEFFFYRAFWVNIILVVCSFFFSSLELLVSFFARNYKEGQILSIPLMFFVLLPFYFLMFTHHDLTSNVFDCVPFLNIPLLFSGVVKDSFSFLGLLIFLVVNIVIIALAAKMVYIIINNETSLIRR